MLFDSHAHLDMTQGGDKELLLQLDRAWQAGLEGIVTIAGATKPGEYGDTIKIVEQDPRIYMATGIHPHAGDRAVSSALEGLRRILDLKKNVALGEIGLDYHYNYSDPKAQRKAFANQIKLAHLHNLPIIVHTRNADADTISILKDEGADELGGVIHCFSSGQALAKEAVEMGFYLSFSGIITFPKSSEIQSVATEVLKDRIMVETDSPFLSPAPHRGKLNEPARVKHVVEKIADLRGIAYEEMAFFTTENAKKCFHIA